MSCSSDQRQAPPGTWFVFVLGLKVISLRIIFLQVKINTAKNVIFSSEKKKHFNRGLMRVNYFLELLRDRYERLF